MPAATMTKHRQAYICDKEREITKRHKDVEMEKRCKDMKLSLYGRDGEALVEGVAKFKCLGRTLDQTDDDWPRYDGMSSRRV